MVPSNKYVTLCALLIHISQRGAKVLIDEDKQAMEVAQKQERARRMEESNLRKETMQKLELTRKKKERPSDLEQVSGAGEGRCIGTVLMTLMLSFLSGCCRTRDPVAS